jgi:hypothetical protein
MKLTMNERGRPMSATTNTAGAVLNRRTEAILTRGPGRLVTRELNEFLEANPGEVVELDFGTHILRIEKVVPGSTE